MMITTTLDLMETIMETIMEAGEVMMATVATAATAIQEETAMAVGEVVMTAAVEEEAEATVEEEAEVTAAEVVVVENEATRSLSIQCGFTFYTIDQHGSLGGIQSVLNRYQYRVSYHFLQIASFKLTARLSTLGWYAVWVDALNRCDVLPLLSTQLMNSLNSKPPRNLTSV